MKKYLLSGLFIFIFAFICQPEVSQSQSENNPFQPTGIDGQCSDNRHVNSNPTLCESGSFILIGRVNSRIHYVCSGSYGGKSLYCEKTI